VALYRAYFPIQFTTLKWEIQPSSKISPKRERKLSEKQLGAGGGEGCESVYNPMLKV